MVALAAIAAALLAWLLAGVRRRGRTHRLPARSLIVSPRKSTVVSGDGSVRSVQSARLTLSRADLDRLWQPANLENLGRTYWRFLSTVTLHLVRVVYTDTERRVILFFRPLTLLRFDLPDYELGERTGRITWRIKDGLLVARSGRGSGWLSLSVKRDAPDTDTDADTSAELSIEVEVANFYPSIAAGFSTLAYEATQAFVHVLVTHAFLRSLARLELAESKVRRFQIEPMRVERGDAGAAPGPERTARAPQDELSPAGESSHP